MPDPLDADRLDAIEADAIERLRPSPEVTLALVAAARERDALAMTYAAALSSIVDLRGERDALRAEVERLRVIAAVTADFLDGDLSEDETVALFAALTEGAPDES